MAAVTKHSPLHCYILQYNYPTGPFTISEPRDQDVNEFCMVQERHATDFEAPKL